MKVLVAVMLVLLLTSCSGADVSEVVQQGATIEPTPVPSPARHRDELRPTSEPTAEPAGLAAEPPVRTAEPAETPALAPERALEPLASPLPFELPDRYCVDAALVKTTLNLRSAPSLDAPVGASIPRLNCGLVGASDLAPSNGFQPVIYSTLDASQFGWVSSDYIARLFPLDAVALAVVEGWQRGADIEPYSYGLDTLPPPIENGSAVLMEGTYDREVQAASKFGCVFVGDVSLTCAVGLVDHDGSLIAEINLGATEKGANGYEGDNYWPDDFPDGPRITSLRILHDYRES